jgi:hypothetical protein
LTVKDEASQPRRNQHRNDRLLSQLNCSAQKVACERMICKMLTRAFSEGSGVEQPRNSSAGIASGKGADLGMRVAQNNRGHCDVEDDAKTVLSPLASTDARSIRSRTLKKLGHGCEIDESTKQFDLDNRIRMMNHIIPIQPAKSKTSWNVSHG